MTIPKLGIVFNAESIVSYPEADKGGGEKATLHQAVEENVEEKAEEDVYKEKAVFYNTPCYTRARKDTEIHPVPPHHLDNDSRDYPARIG
nr:hypothetical protein KXZ65_17505 [Pectobacterium sp. PL152]